MLKRQLALCRMFFVFSGICMLPAISFSQTYSPITVSGYNQDVIAESGTSSLTTTTMPIDGVTVSNKVMYSVAFRTANAFGGGGVPDNGTITNGAMTFQLANYTGNNCVLIPRNQTGTFTLTTPAKYTSLRFLCLSTEGVSLVNGVINFSDGTTTAIPSFSVGDWFNGTTNLVLSGFGRCTRATPATGAGDYPNNPNLYYATVPVACADRGKNIQSITLNNVTTAGNNAPYPNACFFAVSGVNYSITPTITNATCAAPGSVTLAVTGNAPPYNIVWNTVPVQTGNTATNLPAGTYTATITGDDACPVPYPVTITGTNTVTLTGNTSTLICAGSSFTTTTTSNAASFLWTANTSAAVAGISNTTSPQPVLTPTQTTTYTLTATTGSCTRTNSFTITVNPLPTISTRGPLNICSGTGGLTPGLTSTGTTFSWTPATGLSSSTALNPVINPAATTPYTVTATLGTCTATSSFTAVVGSATANAGTPVTIQKGTTTTLNGTGTAGSTYLWTPSTGLSSTSILTPVATPPATTTYTLQVTTPLGCIATSTVTVTVLFDCIRDLSAFTPNGDGFYDKWVITNGTGCTKNILVHVYNRAGSEVYESKNYNNDWDGTYKGKPVPDGTYYYVISFTMADGSLRVAKGPVAIIR